MALRSLINTVLGRFGYSIGKYPGVAVQPIPVFHVLVQELMRVRGRSLTAIQVGANDGRGFGDPLTRYFSDFGWRGVLVEPQPDVCDLLKKNYASAADRLAFENVAIARGGGVLAMYRQRGTGSVQGDQATYASSVVSTDPAVVARQLGVSRSEIERFEVPTASLDDLVRKHGVRELDVLQVDTEGYEREVLETLTLTSCCPLLIQFEHGHMKPSALRAVFNRLSHAGYAMLYGGRQIDSLACHRTALESMDCL